jgi:hypothetical protein
MSYTVFKVKYSVNSGWWYSWMELAPILNKYWLTMALAFFQALVSCHQNPVLYNAVHFIYGALVFLRFISVLPYHSFIVNWLTIVRGQMFVVTALLVAQAHESNGGLNVFVWLLLILPFTSASTWYLMCWYRRYIRKQILRSSSHNSFDRIYELRERSRTQKQLRLQSEIA